MEEGSNRNKTPFSLLLEKEAVLRPSPAKAEILLARTRERLFPYFCLQSPLIVRTANPELQAVPKIKHTDHHPKNKRTRGVPTPSAQVVYEKGWHQGMHSVRGCSQEWGWNDQWACICCWGNPCITCPELQEEPGIPMPLQRSLSHRP